MRSGPRDRSPRDADVPLRVLHITNSFRRNGTGITNVVADLAMTQGADGHDVRVACAEVDAPMTDLATRHGVAVDAGYAARTPRSLLSAARRLRRLIRASDPDIVHVHTVRAALLAALAAPLLFRRRSVATIHNEYQRSVAAMCTTTAVVCVSDADAASIRRKTLVRRPGVIMNGVLESPRTAPLDTVVPVDLPGRPIVYVGALVERKGVDVLLAAMVDIVDRVPDARLYLVGNRDNPGMEQLSTRLGLDDHVRFVGFSDDPRRYILAADVFVLPSRAEPFGLVLVEARATRVPVVATRVGGIPEALSGGSAGLLVAPGRVDELAAAITSVLIDPAVADDLRERSQRGLDAFTVRGMASAYESVYRVLVQRSRLGAPPE